MNPTDIFAHQAAGPRAAPLLSRGQLHELERTNARMIASLRRLLDDTPLSPATRERAEHILAQAERNLVAVYESLELGWRVG